MYQFTDNSILLYLSEEKPRHKPEFFSNLHFLLFRLHCFLRLHRDPGLVLNPVSDLALDPVPALELESVPALELESVPALELVLHKYYHHTLHSMNCPKNFLRHTSNHSIRHYNYTDNYPAYTPAMHPAFQYHLYLHLHLMLSDKITMHILGILIHWLVLIIGIFLLLVFSLFSSFLFQNVNIYIVNQHIVECRFLFQFLI